MMEATTTKKKPNLLPLHCLRSFRFLLLQLDQTSRTRIPVMSLPTKIWRPALAALHLVHAFQLLPRPNDVLQQTVKEHSQIAADPFRSKTYSTNKSSTILHKDNLYPSPTPGLGIFRTEDVDQTLMHFLTLFLIT